MAIIQIPPPVLTGSGSTGYLLSLANPGAPSDDINQSRGKRFNGQSFWISIDVIDTLTDVFILRGIRAYIRSDNGPEFVAQAVRDWIKAVGAQTAYIEPDSPWENGYRESFNARFRDELLNGEVFYTLQVTRGSNHHRTMEETLRHHQTTQCFGLPPVSPGNHHPNRPTASHVLTFKLDPLTGRCNLVRVGNVGVVKRKRKKN